jgi:hypothetical protein
MTFSATWPARGSKTKISAGEGSMVWLATGRHAQSRLGVSGDGGASGGKIGLVPASQVFHWEMEGLPV